MFKKGFEMLVAFITLVVECYFFFLNFPLLMLLKEVQVLVWHGKVS
jgi:hypothetical protein